MDQSYGNGFDIFYKKKLKNTITRDEEFKELQLKCINFIRITYGQVFTD